jgi:hypothetical protein
MGTLQQMEEVGMDVELEAHFAEFFLSPDTSKQDELKKLIDQGGLKHPTVMKMIGAYQREEVLKPGIFKMFAEMHERLGGAAPAATPATTPAATPATTPAATPAATPTAPAAAQKTEMTEEEIAAYKFSESDEERIKEKLKKEEERMRARLLDREKKIRERMITGKSQRAQRLGLKAEDAAKVEVLLKKIKEAQEQKQAMNNMVKECRAEIDKIRPKRKRAPVTEEVKNLRIARRKLTMATKKSDAAGIKEFTAEVARLAVIVEAQQPAKTE